MSEFMESNDHKYKNRLTFVPDIIIKRVKHSCRPRQNLKYCIGKINNPHEYIT